MDLVSNLSIPTVSLPRVDLTGLSNMDFKIPELNLPEASLPVNGTGEWSLKTNIGDDLKLNKTLGNPGGEFGFGDALNLAQTVANVGQLGLAYMGYRDMKHNFDFQKKAGLASMEQRIDAYNNNLANTTNIMNQMKGNAVGSDRYNQFNQTNALNNYKTYNTL